MFFVPLFPVTSVFVFIYIYIIIIDFRRTIRTWHHRLEKELLSLIRRRLFRAKVLNSERASITSYPIVPSPDELQCGAILLSLSHFYIHFLLQWKHSNTNLPVLRISTLIINDNDYYSNNTKDYYCFCWSKTYSVTYRFLFIFGI